MQHTDLGFPRGWFVIAFSEEVERGEVYPKRYFDEDVAVWRDEEGTVHVFDAYCPHLGAHLGHGGKVEGKCLRCPFHAWRFDGEGRCDAIPYAKRIPPKARVGSWPVEERNGLVMVWYPRGVGAEDYVPTLKQFGAPAWSP